MYCRTAEQVVRRNIWAPRAGCHGGRVCQHHFRGAILENTRLAWTCRQQHSPTQIKMTDLDLNRSVKFVSLDTHPANDSLVVSYEILVSVLDRSNKRELTRRSKRDQMQIQIASIDKWRDEDLKPDKLAANLRLICEQIVQKCPMLVLSQRTVEEVKLNLLYLVNRRQQNRHMARQRSFSSASFRDRLESSNLQRGASGASNKRQSSAASVRRGDGGVSAPLSNVDVYMCVCRKEQQATDSCEPDEDLNVFMCQLDAHLREHELELEESLGQKTDDTHSDLDSQLEDLYGDDKQRKVAISSIRRLSRDEAQLSRVCSNKLLVSALLRTLRDLDSNEHTCRESILYILIRLTTFEDVYLELFNSEDGGTQLDLVRIAVDLLAEHARQLCAQTQADENKEASELSVTDRVGDCFYQTNSLLVLLLNLFKLDRIGTDGDDDEDSALQATDRHAIRAQVLKFHCDKFVETQNNLYSLLATNLDPKLEKSSVTHRNESSLPTLSRLISLTRFMCIFRDFVIRLRSAESFSGCLIELLNTLQLSRETTTRDHHNSHQQALDKDTISLLLYQTELDLLKLVTNLLFDSKLRVKLVKKGLLLKCVLRNLVVFLASRRHLAATLGPFNKSAVLLVPAKCLYELSCQDAIKEQLYSSKIILTCLFEYLLSCSADLKATLEQTAAAAAGQTASVRRPKTALACNEEILLIPDDASQYFVALWVNLSARKFASFYQTASGLCDLLRDSIETTLAILGVYTSELVVANVQLDEKLHLKVYIHLKLLRNLTHFLARETLSSSLDGGHCTENTLFEWLEKLCLATKTLLAEHKLGEFEPLSVECLASLTNLLRKSTQPAERPNQALDEVFRSLLALDLNEFASESDDLLLVSINFLRAFAKECELCDSSGGRDAFAHKKVLEMSLFVFDSKASDTEMVLATLRALKQLANHLSFFELLDCKQNCADQETNALVGGLVERLCLLVAHSEVSVRALANLLLSLFKQLDEQRSLSESVANERRFAIYNTKWLAAIKATSNGDDSAAASQQSDADVLPDYDEDDEDNYRDEDDTFNQLRLFGGGGSDDRTASSGATDSAKSGGAISTRSAESLASLAADEDDELIGPDLNVVDAKSMITHLTERQEFRNNWLRR